MKNPIELFATLGDRLAAFGDDARTAAVIAGACAANPWFTPAEIRRAVDALRTDMLDRARLAAWLGRYPLPVARRADVLVVMAGNIPLVGFFDLLCVVAAGDRCLVKPSAKDRVLTEYVVRLLLEIDPEAPVALAGDDADADAVIATGSDNANRYFRTRYAGIPTLLRGSRHSAAVLSGEETEADLDGLADDLFAYSGLGCRSVSLLFLPRGYMPPLRAAAHNPKYGNNYQQTRALLAMTGTPYRDLHGAVLAEGREFPRELSRIHYTYYDTPAEAEAWLAAHDDELQCVVSRCVAHPRRADFGRAQRPALDDYPDDRDTMQFLLEVSRGQNAPHDRT